MSQLGKNRKFYVGGTGTGTPSTWLAGEQSNSFNRTAEMIEISDKSTEWQNFVSGKKGATAEVTVYTDDAATSPQKTLLEAFAAGTKVRCFVGVLSTGSTPTATEGDVFEALVNSVSDSNDNGAVASRTLSLTVCGAPTHYPASNSNEGA